MADPTPEIQPESSDTPKPIAPATDASIAPKVESLEASNPVPPATKEVLALPPAEPDTKPAPVLPETPLSVQSKYPKWLPQLPHVVYLCLVAQNFKALDQWFWVEVYDLKKGWEIFFFLAMLLVWRTWVWRDRVADRRVDVINSANAATNSVLNATNSFLNGQITAMTNENNTLHAEMERKSREADTKESKSQAEYSAKLQQRDAEINRLTTEKVALQTRNDFWAAQSATILEACSNFVQSQSITASSHQETEALISQVQTVLNMQQDYKSLAEANTSMLATLGASAPELQVAIDGVPLPMKQSVFNMAIPLTNDTQALVIVVRNMGNQTAERINIALTFSSDYTNSIVVPETSHGWTSEPFMKEQNGRMVSDNDIKNYSVTSDMPIAAGGAGFQCSDIVFKHSADKPHDYAIDVLAASGGAKPCLVHCTLHFRPSTKESHLE
jgi:hypothetical protein